MLSVKMNKDNQTYLMNGYFNKYMGEKTEIQAENQYQIHYGRIDEFKSQENKTYIVDLGHIDEHELTEYNGLKVEDVSDKEQYDYEPFDSGNRLLRTENGEFLIVHHSVVPTGPWSFVDKKEQD